MNRPPRHSPRPIAYGVAAGQMRAQHMQPAAKKSPGRFARDLRPSMSRSCDTAISTALPFVSDHDRMDIRTQRA